MAGFNFERDLPHQTKAITAILGAFNEFELKPDPKPAMEKVCNPLFKVTAIKLSVFEDNECIYEPY